MARFRLGDVVSAVDGGGERCEGEVVVIVDDAAGDDPEPYLIGFPPGGGAWALDVGYRARAWLPESALTFVRRGEAPTAPTGPAASGEG
jgi:hypothetical protein